MTDIELLWEYQQADVAVDRLQAEMKRSPTRLKLVKYRDTLEEQTKVYKRIESEIAAMADRLENLKDAISLVETQFKALQSRSEENPPTSSADVSAYITEAKKLKDDLSAYEREINKIRKDCQDRERQQHDVKVRYAKVKNEFSVLKEQYDTEYKTFTDQLEELKAAAKEKAKGIPKELWERYCAIKRHSVPPLARLTGDKCGGCNMSLPSGAVRSIKNGEFTECETCGRLVTL